MRVLLLVVLACLAEARSADPSERRLAGSTVWAPLDSLAPAQDRPTPSPAESPNIKVLTGLLVPDFVAEMEFMVQALGVSCQFCHVRNNYAAETNDHKITARRMIEMTKLINQKFFPEYIPPEGESKLGKVTCMTCHQGNEKPKSGN